MSYKTFLMENLYVNPPTRNKSKRKVSNEQFTILKFKDWEKILVINYNISQLKSMCRFYKQKLSGNKNVLIKRIYNFLRYSSNSAKIQKMWRGFFIRKYNLLRGPAAINRKCVNSTDFLSLNDLTDISYNQFFSFKDDEGFIYGFDAKSLHNLLNKTKNPKNPYNRKVISPMVIKNFEMLVRYSQLLKQNMVIKLIDTTASLSIEKRIELNALTLFHKIDSFGHITNVNWFLSLNKPTLIRLIRELIEIWNYRASLTNNIKISICPPHGNPFSGINIQALQIQNIHTIKINVLNIFDNLISKSPDRNNQALGAFYILGSITLVNVDAAIALPWLYESVYYLQP
jgi:hypothetical protein